MMIYLDNASTSYPKPLEAIKIATSLLERQPLTLNRRGYFSNVDFVDEIELLRSRLKRFIGADKEDRLICVLNATEAINIALFSLLNPGDHVITSVYEHSAVTRTLLALRTTKNITFDVVKCDTKITCQDIEKLMTQSTKLVVLSHVSNVTGNVLIEKNIGSLLKKHGIKYLIDASQTIGNIDFNVKEYSPDILCFSGHKSLMGLTGTGFLYLKSTLDFQQFRFGGVGHSSELDFLPIKQDSDYEVGTQNVFGILFLNESLNFIENIGLKTFYMKKEQNLNYLIKKMTEIEEVKLYGRFDDIRASIVSINITNMSPDRIVAPFLENVKGIITRAGLHCSPWCHKALGTFPNGTVRISPGFFNSVEDIDVLISSIKQLSQQKDYHVIS